MSRLSGIVCVMAAFCLCSQAGAQVSGPLTLRPAVPEDNVESVTMEAPLIEANDTVFTAQGGVRFTSGEKRARAQKIAYNTATSTGQMLNARFTTCNEENPHYYLSARSIVLGAGNWVSTRGASLTLFGVKVITLPMLSFRVGNRQGGSTLPTPGYDSRDGITLGHSFVLMDSPRSTAVAGIKLTAKHGYQLEMTAQHGLDGLLSRPPGRLLRYDSLQNEVRDVSAKDGPLSCLADLHSSRLTAFGSLSLRSRATDLHNTSLVYYKRPEVGLYYVPRHVNLCGAGMDPRLQLLPEIVASWGRYAEIPNPFGTVGRTGASVSLPVRAFKMSPDSAVQPILTYSWAEYSTGSTYRVFGWGLDYSKIFRDGSFATLRYTQKNDSGFTPFEFDDLDYSKVLEIGAQLRRGRHTYGFVGSMDASRGTLEDWEAIYGYRLDCLAGVVSWNGRYKQFRFGVDLLGL